MTAWTLAAQQQVERLMHERDAAARELAEEIEVYKEAKKKLDRLNEAVFEAARMAEQGQSALPFKEADDA